MSRATSTLPAAPDSWDQTGDRCINCPYARVSSFRDRIAGSRRNRFEGKDSIYRMLCMASCRALNNTLKRYGEQLYYFVGKIASISCVHRTHCTYICFPHDHPSRSLDPFHKPFLALSSPPLLVASRSPSVSTPAPTDPRRLRSFLA